jgi:hypothetical protein
MRSRDVRTQPAPGPRGTSVWTFRNRPLVRIWPVRKSVKCSSDHGAKVQSIERPAPPTTASDQSTLVVSKLMPAARQRIMANVSFNAWLPDQCGDK